LVSDRSLIASIAAHERWAREPDRSAATARARQANADRYLSAARALHPTLSEGELRIRAANLRSADATRMARARWSKDAKKAPAPLEADAQEVESAGPTLTPASQ
jgi:hypothetical protein